MMQRVQDTKHFLKMKNNIYCKVFSQKAHQMFG